MLAVFVMGFVYSHFTEVTKSEYSVVNTPSHEDRYVTTREILATVFRRVRKIARSDN